jgi:hypothetical protein
MKTSNILIIIFVGSITLYFLAAFTEIRLVGNLKSDVSGPEWDEHSIPISTFRYLRASDLKFSVSFSDEASLAVRTEKGKVYQRPTFQQRGDTLIIGGFEPGDEAKGNLHLTLPRDSFRDIHCTGCQITLEHGSTDSLALALEGGTLTKWSSDTSYFRALKIVASKDTRMTLLNMQIDNLDVTLDNCLLDIRGPINTLTGSMVNSTHISLDEVLDFDFSRDHSSMLNHRK